MGGGKGGLEMYRAPVRPGRIIFEISGIPAEQAQEALTLAAYKLPLKTKYVTHEI
jgi:large subunit ribosomal protein L16